MEVGGGADSTSLSTGDELLAWGYVAQGPGGISSGAREDIHCRGRAYHSRQKVKLPRCIFPLAAAVQI